MLRKWKVKAELGAEATDLAKKLNISPLLASILLSRGIDSREKGELFLHPERIEYCDPYLLPDMRLAVDRIVMAISMVIMMLMV